MWTLTSFKRNHIIKWMSSQLNNKFKTFQWCRCKQHLLVLGISNNTSHLLINMANNIKSLRLPLSHMNSKILLSARRCLSNKKMNTWKNRWINIQTEVINSKNSRSSNIHLRIAIYWMPTYKMKINHDRFL